jgi:NTE family protein
VNRYFPYLLCASATIATLAWIGGARAQREGVPPSFVAPAAVKSGKAIVALVLSGGAARGYAHEGVIKVLEAEGLRPDLVVGCSAGSIVGSLYASGLTVAELDQAIGRLDSSSFDDWAMPGLGFRDSPLGLFKGENLHAFLDANLKHHLIEQFPIRFAAAATNFATGEVAIFNTGDAGIAVHASSAVPGVIAPAKIRGTLYGDCQVSSPLPVLAARRMGATRVIAVDVIYPPRDARLDSTMGVLFQSMTISTYRLKEFERGAADVVIAPNLPRTAGQLSFEDRKRIIAAGEAAAREALERLRKVFRR